MSPVEDPYSGFSPGFFARADESDDSVFYDVPRLVTHIDDRAIAALGPLYAELIGSGRILDLMSSWISHLSTPPTHLTVLGMNDHELGQNPMADEQVVHDLNLDPSLPFADGSFDGAICTVSVDYLTKPFEVFTEMARVLTPGGTFVCTFSNRCFPTKAIRGWGATDDLTHLTIVSEYFRRSTGWGEPQVRTVFPPGSQGDPLYAVWAATTVGS